MTILDEVVVENDSLILNGYNIFAITNNNNKNNLIIS